jgi:hypothetical protein
MVAQEMSFRMTASSLLYAAAESEREPPSLRERMLAFLNGETHGEELLHMLYDHVLREPIPERLRALLRGS